MSATWKRVVGFALGSAVCFAVLDLLPEHQPGARTHELARATAGASSSKVSRLYEKWVERHENGGGDRNVQIGLGPGRGLTSSGETGRGVARLDLIVGAIDVQVAGLGSDAAWDVWLVDNVDAPGNSAMVDATDTLRRAGTVATTNGSGSMRAELGSEAFTGFEVDLVTVTPAGREPTAQSALFGMPTAFQRLYTRDRRGVLITDAPAPRLISRALNLVGTQEVHAAGIVVDPDVLLDSMVEEGADLFINETFDGNGRTCATCHPPSNNYTIDPDYIASLPQSDALFVAENNPALAALDDSEMLREFALVRTNADGFANPAVLRSVPHVLGLSQTIAEPTCVDGFINDDCTLVLPPPPSPTQVHLPFDQGQQAAFVDDSTPLASGYPAVAPFPGYNPTDPIHDISVTAHPRQRTGWGGDGAPGSGTLREFAIGAVVQYLPLTLDRVPAPAGDDFRLPTDDELDALEVFQLSLGREEDIDLRAITFIDPQVQNGLEIFMRNKSFNGFGNEPLQAGKCETCHYNAGANSTPEVFGDEVVVPLGFPRGFGGNLIWDTGVTDFTEAQGSQLPDDLDVPVDSGFGIRPLIAYTMAPLVDGCVTGTVDFVLPPPPGAPPFAFNLSNDNQPGGFGSWTTPTLPYAGLCNQSFNTPPLVEAADTAPYFHDNSAETLEDAVAFYSTPAFNEGVRSKSFLGGTDFGVGINLTPQSTEDVAAFLRVLNALENLRQSDELVTAARSTKKHDSRDQLLVKASQELNDARSVLDARALHSDPGGAVDEIESAILHIQIALSPATKQSAVVAHISAALTDIQQAQDHMVVF